MRFESPVQGGVKLVKTYTLKRGDYDLAVKHEVINAGAAPVAPQLYLQLVRDGNKLPGESSFYSTFTGPAVYTPDEKFHKVDFKDIEKGKAEIDKNADGGYVAMVQHYFASAWILPDGVTRENFVRKVDSNLYAVGMITPVHGRRRARRRRSAPSCTPARQEESKLERAGPRPGPGEGLRLAHHPGQAAVLAAVQAARLHRQLGLVHRGAGAACIKIAFYWLQAKGYESMAKMKAINPKVMAMRERLQGQPAADAAGDDAHLPRGEGQPAGRLPADRGPDPGVHRAVLGAAVVGGDAQRALDRLDPRPVGARPVLHPAGADDADARCCRRR